MTKYREMRPKEYTYKAIPIGTRILIKREGKWHASENSAIGRTMIVVDEPPSSFSSEDNIPYISAIGELYPHYIYGISKSWPCWILEEVQYCMRCHQDFIDETPHYLCPDCRL